MSLKKFNEESEKPRFTSKHNPLVPRSYQIFEYKKDKEQYEPVGEYTVIDTSETPDITDIKVANLVTLMNEKKNLIDFKNLTSSRVLFNIIQETPETDRHKVIFRTHDGKGVSKENAVLTIEKGVFHESQQHR